MDRLHPCFRLDVIVTPAGDIMRLWRTFRPVDRAFLRLIVGDLPLLADSPIDWTLFRIAISFWDTQRAVFSFQGTELVPTVFRPSDRDYTDWKQFMEGLTPAQFLWAARWNPDGPMTIGCLSVTRLPLISHLGSTLIFPARVIRQLGGQQDIPIEADRTPYRFMWADTTASFPDRFLRAPQADIPDAESSIQGAMRTKLQSIREKRDRLRYELVDTHSELTDHRELQRELAQIRARVANQDREIARLSATLDRVRMKKCKVSHP
ncbi:hypothetical protein CRG98_021774 [Punica granatum]|uniref:Aminotransferase-like plant mobile domain-containing protein n=1 Tax=Punica granatum TaxID=22663 RepID=A0A2I0JNG3_PUNGR|nr:hypothetical protein CRG98_021774 [Punica granatum]